MNTTSTMTVGRTKVESADLVRARQERLRQLRVPAARRSTRTQYVPRHRADVQADAVA